MTIGLRASIHCKRRRCCCGRGGIPATSITVPLPAITRVACSPSIVVMMTRSSSPHDLTGPATSSSTSPTKASTMTRPGVEPRRGPCCMQHLGPHSMVKAQPGCRLERRSPLGGSNGFPATESHRGTSTILQAIEPPETPLPPPLPPAVCSSWQLSSRSNRRSMA